MTTEDYKTYHDKKIVNRESEMRKTLISVRLSTLTDDDKLELLTKLRVMVENEINDLARIKLFSK